MFMVTLGVDILQDAALQEFALAAPGQADHIGVEFAHLRGDLEFGGQAVQACSAQDKVRVSFLQLPFCLKVHTAAWFS